MKKYILFLIIAQISFGKLIPTPLVTDPEPTQRFTAAIADSLLETHLFGQCHGISFVKIRDANPENWLGVISDPVLDDLVYILGVDSSGERYSKFINGFDDWQNPQYFDRPMGLVCDSTIFNGDSSNYFVYTADCYHNRIVRSYYDSDDEAMYFYDYMLEGTLSEPEDIACVSIPGGGSFFVVADTKNDCIRLGKINSNLADTLLKTYGTEGSGIGQFRNPTSVAQVQCKDSSEYYRIYVVDQRNYRIVSLLYNATSNSFSWERTFEDNTMQATFLSVTSNPYYCVYVTDGAQSKIWVFTPGLLELLYTYGSYGYNEDQFITPRDICIYQNEIAITELWSNVTGIQYFEIVPEISDFYPEPDTFDALIDSVKINFKVCETDGYLTMLCCDDTIINNQYFEPGTSSVYWDGREGSGKPAIPGTHPIYIRCPGYTVGTAYVTVKGTKIEGSITDLHWTTTGNPYVLVENSYTSSDETLTIDPGVLVMGHDANSCLDLMGTLKAAGTVNDSIIFTGHRKLLPVEDTTYAGMWNCIRHSGYSEYPSTMKYCLIEYANIGLEMWSDWNVMVDTVENCYFKENIIPVYCDFKCAGIFGYNNDYADNDTNKIKVIPDPPSKDKEKVPDIPILSSPSCTKESTRGVTDMTIKNQWIPFWFRYESDGKFTVYGNEDSVMTLTIEPGIQIEFDPNTILEIGDEYDPDIYYRGRLICDGLENDTIKLIGADNGSWKGIRFCPEGDVSDTSSIIYTLIESAGSDTGAIMLGDSTSITITNSKICNSPNYGLWMANNSPYDNITISQCLFENDSIPILSSFGNLSSIDTCTYSDNLYERIDVVGQEVVSKDVNVFDYSLPYYFLNQDPFGSKFSLYGNGSLATLTIDPNVNILCDSAVSIEIGNTGQKASNRTTKLAYTDNPTRDYRGKVTAVGNDSMPIVFTAMYMDNPWSGITIYADDSQDTSAIKYCEISHALKGIDIYNTSPVIGHSSIANTENAIIVSGSGAGPAIDSNLIVMNTCGIYNTDTGSTVLSLSYNDIYGNKTAVKNEVTGHHVDADSNWWGASSGPWDPTDTISGPPDYNPGGTGDSIGDYVVYRHWLTQPVHDAQVTLIFPNGGESLYVEIDTVIQWTRSLGVTPIKQELYYTTDFPEGGSLRESLLWQFIDTVNVNDTDYTWHVPMTLSQRCRVALKLHYASGAKKGISDTRDDLSLSEILGEKLSSPSKILQENHEDDNRSLYDNYSRSTATIAVDISDANFVIADTVSPQITLDYPTGSEYFIPTEQETIQWQASDNHKLDHFDIFLSEDGGYTYTDTIIEDLEAPCSTYAWTVPEKNNYMCKIMVVAYDSSTNDNNDACDSIFYIPVKSFSDKMSAYNNATRMVRSFSANIHLVYATTESEKFDKSKKYKLSTNINQSMLRNEKQTRGDKVYYIKSTNFGIVWQSPTEIGNGIYPAISMNDNATKMGAAWQNSGQDEIYYRYWIPLYGWRKTSTLFGAASDITYSPPAIAFANDTMHLTTIRTEEISRTEIVQDVLYAKFYWSNASPTMSLDTVNHWRITYSGDYPQFSSIAVDGSNRAHVAWERPPSDTLFSTFTPFDIHYSEQNGPGFSTVSNVSNSDSNSINPSIECYGGHYYIVWQEKVNGYNIFLYKRNYTGFPPSSQTDTISQSAGKYPVTSMGGVVWATGDTADIYGRIWDSQEEEWLDITNWSNTPRHSMYPQVDAWQDEGGIDIIVGWTEDTDTSGFGKKFVSIFPYGDYGNISFPSYFLDLGDSLSTPFTEHRDTCTSLNECWYDFGEDSLIYSLPIINRLAKCRLYVELYRPESCKDAERGNNSEKRFDWRIRLNVDNFMHHVITLTPGETKKLDLDVPWLVNVDGTASIKFRKIIGDGIFARRILFYEYERFGDYGGEYLAGGGPQNKESVQITPIFFEGIHPNPTKGDFIVRFTSPDQRNVRISLYDVTGRLIDEIFNSKIQTSGVYEIPIRSQDLAAGIYFIRIETDNETITEKVIILK